MVEPTSWAPMLACSAADNYLRYMALPIGDDALTLRTFQFTRQDFERVQPEGLKASSIDVDLTKFKTHGGKLIMDHGWADPLLPPRGTVHYYTRLQDRLGGVDATRQLARLFMFPGLFHCAGGGSTPATSDLILDLVNWVEQGQAPDQVTGTQSDANGQVVRTRRTTACIPGSDRLGR